MVNSKKKGSRGELELVHFLKDYGHDARRGQQYRGSPDSPDVVCPSLGFLNIEVKRRNRLNIEDSLQQATRDAKAGQAPSVWHRADGQEWKVTLWAKDFLELIDERVRGGV